MKKIGKILIFILLIIDSLILVDGFSARYFRTRPLIAKKEKTVIGVSKSGVVYKSLFANVYYCDAIDEYYDEEHNLIREEKTVRFYKDKDDTEFQCEMIINVRDSIFSEYYDEAKKYNDLEYMKLYAKGLYEAKYNNIGSYNKKMNIYIVNFIGDYKVSDKYQDVYMFDIDDFTKEPVKLEIDGFDMAWRSSYIMSSPTGNSLAFYYGCGYKEMWAGEQKYSYQDCVNNKKTSGIYVFKVNGINDYEQMAYLAEDRNEYTKEYPDTYFLIDKVISDDELVIKYIVSKNKQEEPIKEIKKIWNFKLDTIKDYQG